MLAILGILTLALSGSCVFYAGNVFDTTPLFSILSLATSIFFALSSIIIFYILGITKNFGVAREDDYLIVGESYETVICTKREGNYFLALIRHSHSRKIHFYSLEKKPPASFVPTYGHEDKIVLIPA